MAERGRRAPDRTVSRVVDDLFRTQLHPEGREWRYVEVAAAINTRYRHLLGDTQVETSHLSKIRTGDIRDPNRRMLMALALFFGVPITRFFPELDVVMSPATNPADQLRHALLLHGLSPALMTHIEGLIREIRLLVPGSAPVTPAGETHPAEAR